MFENLSTSVQRFYLKMQGLEYINTKAVLIVLSCDKRKILQHLLTNDAQKGQNKVNVQFNFCKTCQTNKGKECIELMMGHGTVVDTIFGTYNNNSSFG